VTAPFALASFLSRWIPTVRHDLASSDSETLTLPELLDLAKPVDLHRWETLGFGYLDPRGAPWLRAAISERHTMLGPDDVLCCAGAQEALASVVGSLLTPQDHAIVVLPIYQPSEEAVTALCPATGIVLREGDGWRLDVDRVAAAIRPETKLVLMNFPNSPTGAVLDASGLAALVDLCRARGLWLVNDEVYQHTDRRGSARPQSVADLYERGVSIDSLSKGFGLAGLRFGWIASRDRALLAAALNTKNRMSSCMSSASEVLGHVALRAEAALLGRARAIGETNRHRWMALVDRHPETFEADASDNLAFAFPRYRGGDAAEFASTLARDADILVLPSTLWRSRLAPVPTDRLRIGLGRREAASAFDVLDAHLSAWPARRKRAR
jgi:aspartate/methionine/tyrosine aminotransferase